MISASRRYCSYCNAAFASQIDKCPRDGADLQVRETNPLLGRVFGNRYRLIERLGGGGMGEVYRAEHITIGKSFAIKVLLGEVAANNDMVARFHREAKALSLLSHRNVVSVADFGETEEGLLYLVTEFVDGTPLSQELRRRPFDLDRTVHVVRQIGKALSHAHRRGLVHRDLKPDNVMLVQEDDEADVVKVLDFGIARVVDSETTESMNQLTTQGIVMGTPAYISPEQAMGTPVDHRADLYSLGVLLYECLVGNVPFKGKNPIELMSKHLREVPPEITRTDISGEFRALTMRLLEKEPENRFKDADTFLTLLEALEDAKPSGTYTPNNPVYNDGDALPLRQGSDTLLAPISAISTMDTEGPTPPTGVPLEQLASAPTDAGKGHGHGRTIALVAFALIAIGGAAFAFSVMTRDANEKAVSSEADTSPEIDLPALVPVITTDAAVAPATVVNELDAEPVPAEDAGEPDAAVVPRSRRATPTRNAVPTAAELQSGVEKIGKRITALTATLGKNEIDTLRRQWLDLATALPGVDDSVESRRRFAARLRKLKNAMKKASRNP